MGIWQKTGKILFFGKIKVIPGHLGRFPEAPSGRYPWFLPGKTRSSADFTIKIVPLQTILCGFVKVRLNNF
jgi:hypothetical protein